METTGKRRTQHESHDLRESPEICRRENRLSRRIPVHTCQEYVRRIHGNWLERRGDRVSIVKILIW